MIGRALSVAGIAAFVGLVGFAVSVIQPTRFSATSLLAFDATSSPEFAALGVNAQVRDPERATEGLRSTVASYDVATGAAALLNGAGLTPDSLMSKITVTTETRANVVRVSAVDSTPGGAERLNAAWLASYRRISRAAESDRARSARLALQTELTRLRPSARRGKEGDSIRDQIGSLSVVERIGSGSPRIVEAPHAENAAADPKTRRNVIFSAVFGIVLGIGLVAIRPQSPGNQLVTA